ncbi:fatty acid desaturase family protein [Pseudomonas syringae pv. syringae]|uniref:fatty acid desaturase family protein n=1 Tax=Pseudomonas syringae TaxID=317 RepID=UPI003A63A994
MSLTAASGCGRTEQFRHEKLRVDHHAVHDLMVLHPVKCLIHIGTQWLMIVLAIGFATWIDSLLAYSISIVWIATRQHALLVLMHDASHHLISRRRWLNDTVGNLFLAFPLGICVSRYRRHHLLHHRHLNTELDPDIKDSQLPNTRIRFYGLLLRDALGVSTLMTLRSVNRFGMLGLFARGRKTSRIDQCLALAFIIAVSGGVTWGGGGWDALWLWVIPALTILPLILRVRSMAEHGGRLEHPDTRNARSIEVGIIERFLWAPCHINRHWEHHLCPAVPTYNLSRLTTRLANLFPQSSAAHRTQGYFFSARSLVSELYPNTTRP